MNFAWLKRYMPRSLYARAALILLVPILTIQLVVTIVFVQRLYEDVTEQMTSNMLYDLDYLLDTLDSAPNPAAARREAAAAARAFDLEVRPAVQPDQGDTRMWYDLSGRIVTEVLREEIPGLVSVDLAQSIRRVVLTVATPQGLLEVDFSRRRVSASNPHQLLVLMALTSILATVIAFVYLRNQLRPVKRLSVAAEAFGQGRIVPFRPSGATEMRAAGSAFLEMRTRIERMLEQRTLMLSGVSHDLRTPLTRLRLALSLLEESPETLAMQRDLSDMEQLLDTFLDFARGDAIDGRMMVDPMTLMRDLCDRWTAGGHRVELVLPETARYIMASPGALTRALENLLGNAVRHGTRTRLSLGCDEGFIRISVEDNGPGIPEDLREEALKPFARLDVARNQDSGPGVGLGLAIAQDVARRHGGNVLLDRSVELGGLRVDLILPT